MPSADSDFQVVSPAIRSLYSKLGLGSDDQRMAIWARITAGQPTDTESAVEFRLSHMAGEPEHDSGELEWCTGWWAATPRSDGP